MPHVDAVLCYRVARSVVSVSVCLSVFVCGHSSKLCINRQSDKDATWWQIRVGPRSLCKIIIIIIVLLVLRIVVYVSTSDLHAIGLLLENISAEMSPVARQANAGKFSFRKLEE